MSDLTMAGKVNKLITSALPYVNNVPHLGNIIGSVLSADVYARFCRSRGYNVLYVCGTDEYGTTTEVRAAQENLTPIEICDKYHEIHKQIYEWFDIKFDHFGRTSTPVHTEVCQRVFQRLDENQCLDIQQLEQLYCDKCEKFLADRLVEGECPKPGCSFICKGDECEQCGAHVNARDLKNPKCKICLNSGLSLRESEHVFLKLSELNQQLRDLHSDISISNSDAKSSTLKLLSNPDIPPKCITRDLKWGVPLPCDHPLSDKVLYVWFDAPLGYVSITKCHTPDWEFWWKNPEQVELHQFMGKDNVYFHTVFFPAMLLGTGETWTRPTAIHATQFLNYEKGKFSKSNGVGIFGDDARDSGIPVEVWRYYLLSVRPEQSDTDFSWKDLQIHKLKGDLADKLGNFVNRVIKFIAKPLGKGCGSIIPEYPKGAELDSAVIEFAATISDHIQTYLDALEKAALKSGLEAAMMIAQEGNKYLQDSKFWKLPNDSARLSIIMKTSVGVVFILACLLEPFMPSFATQVLKQLNLEPATISLSDEFIDKARKPWDIVPSGHKIGIPDILFKTLSDDEITVYTEKYSGTRAVDSKKPSK